MAERPGTVAGMRYPEAHRLDLVETIHGHRIADPYRWLEHADAADTTAWSAAQDELVAAWSAGGPGRDRLRSRLHQLLPGSVSAPLVIGERRFFLRRLPDQEHAVLWVEEGGQER